MSFWLETLIGHVKQNGTASALIDIAHTMDLLKYVGGATHVSGNTLHLIFSRQCENFIAEVVIDSLQILYLITILP